MRCAVLARRAVIPIRNMFSPNVVLMWQKEKKTDMSNQVTVLLFDTLKLSQRV